MKTFGRTALALTALFSSVSAYAARPPFETPAPVAFMKDLSSGAILYAKDADRKMPPASMAKMMTVYVAFDLIKKGELKLDQMVTVRPETWQRWHGSAAGSTMFLSPGEQLSVRNLLFGIITLSGNDACVVLAEAISGTEPAFTELMNRYAAKLGMKDSHFGTSNGWPDEGVTYVTARDLASLATATILDHPELYKTFYSRREFTWGKTMSGADITQGNRDPLLGAVDGADGLKTGHTEEAGYGFTGSAIQNGRRLVMVVAGLDSMGARREQSISFMNWGFRAWQAKWLLKKGQEAGKAKVKSGAENEVSAVAPRDLAVTIPAGLGSEIGKKVVLDANLEAPIKKGQHVGDLVVTTPDMPPQKLPLVAAADVEEAGIFRRIWLAILSIFGLA